MEKAKKYSSLKYSLNIIETAYELLLLLSFLGSGLSVVLSAAILKFTANILLIVPLYILIIGLAYYVLSFPLNYYHSFVLEHRFSLSTQNFPDWFGDQVKAGLISYLIFLILIGAFYYILGRFSNTWWLVVSLLWIMFSLIFAKLTPVVIIPLFFKYKKLSDDTLKARIMNLADKMKVKILDCFEIDFSKKTLKANAAFVGMGGTKRVILADTLKDKYTYDEIEVILAHEFAHYRLRHLLKLILVSSMATVVSFYLIFKTSKGVLNFFYLAQLSDIAALPVILMYFFLFGIIMRPFENYISRKFETSADKMALAVTGNKDAFVSMMDKLAGQNLADRNPHPLVKFYFFDHPPIDERIRLAKDWGRRLGTFPGVPPSHLVT